MRIAIWGFGKPVIDTVKILDGSEIEVVYVKCDYHRKNIDQFKDELIDVGVHDFYVEEVPNVSIDLVFTINYNRIIPEVILSKYRIVNYHVGLLPMWRGNSANGWAIINGNGYVGYTIHEMYPMLDSGPVYYQFSFPYIEGDTYFTARTAMAEDFRKKIASILLNIHNNSLMGEEQSGQYVYCSSFRPGDGVVNWNDSSDMLLRKFYVFGPPLGTGLTFQFKGKYYSITKLSKIEDFSQSIGIPGGIVYITGNSMWIKTGDSAISIDEVAEDGKIVDIKKCFTIGQRL